MTAGEIVHNGFMAQFVERSVITGGSWVRFLTPSSPWCVCCLHAACRLALSMTPPRWVECRLPLGCHSRSERTVPPRSQNSG